MQNDVSSDTMVFIFQVNEIYDLRKVTHIPNRNKYTTSIGAYVLSNIGPTFWKLVPHLKNGPTL